MKLFSNFLQKAVDTLDEEIGKVGLQQTMLNIIRRTETKFRVYGRNKKTDRILKTKPIIIIGNHFVETDPICLFAALPPRDDLYAVSDSILSNFCPQIDKHLIPVFIHHNYETFLARFKSNFLRGLNHSQKLSPEEAHQKNIQSIKRAGKMLRTGSSIIILPGGNNGKWKPGIGHLIKEVREKDKVYIIKILFEGTSNLDYFRLIPGIRKILPPLKVTLSRPKSIKFLRQLEPKEITYLLRDEYFHWVRRLHIHAVSRRRRLYIKLIKRILDFVLFTLLPPAFVPVYRESPAFYRPKSPKDTQEAAE